MRRSRFSEEQVTGVLKSLESGQKVADVCRQHGISQGTYFRWKAKYGGLEVSEARRLRALAGKKRSRQLVCKRPQATASRLRSVISSTTRTPSMYLAPSATSASSAA